ncbi:ABC transporter permease [Mesorhizobium kowhaii]|jgi:ribose transport system permease protein|uniref:ABC transporter permease n=1 Tax=Mesorhizobium kowhaii TaxID=1300272 RepID=A0A2W7BRR0_9HYPH|nr:ABC transporter permease [Mesorhizobium kowhaii]PZV33312.1 ABC transporter permease [Mesorhizobium kowhaii]
MSADHSLSETSAPAEAPSSLPSTLARYPSASARDRRAQLMRLLGTYGTIIVLASMLVIFSALQPATFATIGNFRNIINDMAIGTIVAAGLTVPLVAGDFDLSIGYVASFCGLLVVGLLSSSGLSIPLAIVLVICLGTIIGIVNGIVVSKIGVNAFIATLGTGTIVVGLNYAYSGGIPLQLTQSRQFTNIAIGRIAGVPHLVIIMAVVLALLWVILNRTVQGQHIKAIGVSPESARRAGVAVDRSRIVAFAIASTCAAIGGVLMASNLGSGQVTAGDSFMLTSFSAAFLGSAALREGQFHILGTLIGVLTVAVGNNGLAMIGAPIFTQFLFTGCLLVVAVALGGIGRRYGRG